MATVLPTHPPLDDDEQHAGGDAEPLLGQRGDASAQQPPEKPLAYNAVTGTAMLAQAGAVVLAVTVWVAIFTMPKLMLFSAHPILNITAVLCAVEAILVVQPTYTPQQKRVGALAHGAFNLLAFLGFAAAAVVIEVNKGDHKRFTSVHGILGLVTYIVLLIQTAVGFTMYFLPSVYGSVDKAKGVWKYHRMSGYVVLTLSLVTVCAATQTDFNLNTIGIKLWVTTVTGILILLGVIPRIRLAKFGIASK